MGKPAVGAADAGVVRIKGTPRALALATDGNGRWCGLDPRLGAITGILMKQGPSNARYGNYFLRLGQRMSKRGIFYPACVPIAVVQRNWREN